jgi:hypothetical protein
MFQNLRGCFAVINKQLLAEQLAQATTILKNTQEISLQQKYTIMFLVRVNNIYLERM